MSPAPTADRHGDLPASRSSRTGFGRPRRLLAPLLAALLLAACAGGGDSGTGGDHAAMPDVDGDTELVAMGPALDPPPPVNPSRHIGPQGRVGQFVAICELTHTALDDPIVWFEQPGRSHSHEFYGAHGIEADSTADELVQRDTSCDKSADRAAYWHPTLYDAGEPVPATSFNAYYRAAPGVDPTEVVPFPLGIAIITGDMHADTPQEGEAVGWTCGNSSKLSDDAPDCPPSAPLHLVLTFQDCWDGRHLDSEDHFSHVAYSHEGSCPDTHPVHLPQIMVTVEFPIHGADHDLSLASGNLYSAHGDFLNAWDPEGLAREVERCIVADNVCDIVSNRQEQTLIVG